MSDYIFEMLFDKIYIVLEPNEQESKEVTRDDGSVATIYTPDKHHKDTRIGRIVSVGPEAKEKGFKVGELVVVTFAVGAILHFPVDDIIDDTHRIVTVREILCKIVEPEKKVLVEV